LYQKKFKKRADYIPARAPERIFGEKKIFWKKKTSGKPSKMKRERRGLGRRNTMVKDKKCQILRGGNREDDPVC